MLFTSDCVGHSLLPIAYSVISLMKDGGKYGLYYASRHSSLGLVTKLRAGLARNYSSMPG